MREMRLKKIISFDQSDEISSRDMNHRDIYSVSVKLGEPKSTKVMIAWVHIFLVIRLNHARGSWDSFQAKEKYCLFGIDDQISWLRNIQIAINIVELVATIVPV